MALARRDYLNNPNARAKMTEASQGLGLLANIPAKSTRGYGVYDLHHAMMTAAALNASVGGCAGAVRRHMERRGDNPDGVVPCGQWFSDRLAGVDTHKAIDSFCGMAAAQLGELEKAGMMPEGGWTMALDMHKICRYDRTRGEELTRSKYENGTMYFERYMSVQCTDEGSHLNLASLPVYMLDSVPEKVRQILAGCIRRGVRIKLVLLDREFFTVDAIRALNDLGTDYLMPCSNRPGVVSAIREFAGGRRTAVSQNTLSGSGGSVPYILVIDERRRCKKNPKSDPPPEETYIGFATSVPDIDIRVYGHRWVVETGYSKVEAMRPRTRSRSRGARLFCFLYALAIFNSWVMWGALLHMSSAVRRRLHTMTQLELKVTVLGMLLAEMLKPPSRAPTLPAAPSCAA
jgi:hypothetical protein